MKKTDTVTITQIVHRSKLYGQWNNDQYSNIKPDFTDDTLYWGGVAMPYVIGGDSIYTYNTNAHTLTTFLWYQLAENGDTLTVRGSTYDMVLYRLK